ncbi:MAG: DUF2156 domain-containing protein [Candidatus Heteroscillospira sp.]
MLQFKPIALEDRDWILSLVKNENSRSADTSFGAMYLWSAGETRYVSRVGDRVILMLRGNSGPIFLCPFGSGSLVPAVREMQEYCDELNKPLILVGVTENYVPLLEKLFPGEFAISRERKSDDYVYSAEKLSTLSGKALHAKRNHINSFEGAYKDWRFEPIRREHIPLCIELMDKWREADPEHIERDVYDERDTLLRCLRDYWALGMYGGVLWAGGEPVAFTMGERLGGDTFVVHFEKAMAEVRGAYPMVNREFVRYIMREFPEIRYINREDDMGLENMRKAKESYKPAMMVEKYTAVRERKP